MYQLTNTEIVIRMDDSANIPADLDNRDYQKYLDWCNAGNTPTPAAKPDPSIRVQVQIDAIEQETQVPRVVRESLLAFAQVLAQQQAAAATAAGTPTTPAQVLAKNVAYNKVKAVDDQIAQLRAQISTSTTITTT
jgi:hypothetical protein